MIGFYLILTKILKIK